MQYNLVEWFFKSKQNKNCTECLENNQEDSKSLFREIHIICTTPLNQEDYFGGIIIFNYNEHQSYFQLNPNIGNLSPGSNDILSSNEIISKLIDVQNICDKLHRFGFIVTEITCLTKCDNHPCNFVHRMRLVDHNHKYLYIEDEIVRFAKYSIYNNYLKNNSGIGSFDINDRYQYKYYDYLLKLNYKNYRILKNKIKQILLLG